MLFFFFNRCAVQFLPDSRGRSLRDGPALTLTQTATVLSNNNTGSRTTSVIIQPNTKVSPSINKPESRHIRTKDLKRHNGGAGAVFLLAVCDLFVWLRLAAN